MRIKIEDLKNALDLTYEEKEFFSDVLNYQEDTEVDIDEIRKELENLEEHSLADGLTNSHTADLLDWYKEDLDRVYYMKEAIGVGAKDGFEILAWGQLEYIREKLSIVKDKILEHLNQKIEG